MAGDVAERSIRSIETGRSPRVAAIVANSVKHDARVLKEAESLRDAGCDVVVVGMKDTENLEDSFISPGGISVRLMPWRALAYAAFSRVVLLILPVGIIAYLVLLRILGSVEAVLQIAGPLVIAYLGLRFHARQARAARHYAGIEYPDSARTQRAARLRPFLRSLSVKPLFQYLQRSGTRRVRNRQFITALEEARPDIVHCHDAQTLPAGIAYKKKHGGKVVFDSHEYFDEISLAGPRERKRLRRSVQTRAREVDGFITVNASIAAALTERYPELPEAVVVMNATRAPETDVVYDGRMHEAARLLPETSILLYQGGLASGRGLEDLVRAAPLLPRSWHLVIMGWGSLQDQLVKLAARVDPSRSRVSFLPKVPQEELALWTAGATVGVIPYERVSMNNWFCSPNKLWEYPRAGVPILVSPFPEMKAIVERYGVGWLLAEEVTPQNIADRVAALQVSDIESAREACRRFILENNWSVYEKRLVDLYLRLADPVPKSTA